METTTNMHERETTAALMQKLMRQHRVTDRDIKEYKRLNANHTAIVLGAVSDLQLALVDLTCQFHGCTLGATQADMRKANFVIHGRNVVEAVRFWKMASTYWQTAYDLAPFERDDNHKIVCVRYGPHQNMTFALGDLVFGSLPPARKDLGTQRLSLIGGLYVGTQEAWLKRGRNVRVLVRSRLDLCVNISDTHHEDPETATSLEQCANEFKRRAAEVAQNPDEPCFRFGRNSGLGLFTAVRRRTLRG